MFLNIHQYKGGVPFLFLGRLTIRVHCYVYCNPMIVKRVQVGKVAVDGMGFHCPSMLIPSLLITIVNM